jgi:hypothetical protein
MDKSVLQSARGLIPPTNRLISQLAALPPRSLPFLQAQALQFNCLLRPY